MRNGPTVIEILVVIFIIFILCGIFYSGYTQENADPTLISNNEKSGQQTWRVPIKRLEEFQITHQEFKTVSMTGITEPFGESSRTVAFVIILEPIPDTPPEKVVEKEK